MTTAHGGRPMAATRIVAAIALLALVAAGCATGSGSAGGASPVATTSVDLPPSYKFEPASIAIKAGATVTWTNDDHFTHSVRFLDGGLPTEPMVMSPGTTVTFTFPTAGTFHYQCHLHPQNMTGTVTVTG
jgi:plastocyanin